MNKNNCQP